MSPALSVGAGTILQDLMMVTAIVLGANIMSSQDKMNKGHQM